MLARAVRNQPGNRIGQQQAQQGAQRGDQQGVQEDLGKDETAEKKLVVLQGETVVTIAAIGQWRQAAELARILERRQGDDQKRRKKKDQQKQRGRGAHQPADAAPFSQPRHSVPAVRGHATQTRSPGSKNRARPAALLGNKAWSARPLSSDTL